MNIPTMPAAYGAAVVYETGNSVVETGNSIVEAVTGILTGGGGCGK